MQKYLRNKNDGFIYDWNPILAKHPLCEEVTEEIAFPERFKPKGRKAKAVLPLDTDQTLIDEALGLNAHPEELLRELNRGWPK